MNNTSASVNDENKVKKIVPSKLENAFYPIVYNTFGKIVPSWMTPNQITLIGSLGGLFGIICAFLSKYNKVLLIGTIFGLLTHIICDDLDGYVARKKNMSSDAGAFFDLITDILHIWYVIVQSTGHSVFGFLQSSYKQRVSFSIKNPTNRITQDLSIYLASHDIIFS